MKNNLILINEEERVILESRVGMTSNNFFVQILTVYFIANIIIRIYNFRDTFLFPYVEKL